jgi:putative PIN family toxin of toxin-antitoxin system
MTTELRTTPGRPPRVVLDTAVVISALVFGGGAAAALRQAWQSGHCRPMLCQATLSDLGQKLSHPRLQLTRSEQSSLVAEYLPHAVRVRLPQGDTRAADGDPAALAFARLAMAGRAHALVTGDAELLGLAGRFTFPVMTLDDFLVALARHAALPAGS